MKAYVGKRQFRILISTVLNPLSQTPLIIAWCQSFASVTLTYCPFSLSQLASRGEKQATEKKTGERLGLKFIVFFAEAFKENFVKWNLLFLELYL